MAGLERRLARLEARRGGNPGLAERDAAAFLDRLEASPGETFRPPPAVLRLLVTPGASGPVVVAAMARRAGEPWRHIDREPGERQGWPIAARGRDPCGRKPEGPPRHAGPR